MLDWCWLWQGVLEGLEEDGEDLQGLKELGEDVESLEEIGEARGVAPAPASAQAQPKHSLEEDSFKTLTNNSH